ncbi:MAG TPA: SMP-30/gluconolactonase/LRE family protein, partial [Eoetvoesiella sp.]
MTQGIKTLATGLQFPEGPVAMQDGSVLLAEIRSGKIKRIARDGAVTTVVDCKGGPNGMAI